MFKAYSIQMIKMIFLWADGSVLDWLQSLKQFSSMCHIKYV